MVSNQPNGAHPGIVDEDVQVAAGVAGEIRECAVPLIRAADIERVGGGAGGAQGFGGLKKRCLVDVAKSDEKVFGGEEFRGFQANTAGRAADEDGFSGGVGAVHGHAVSKSVSPQYTRVRCCGPSGHAPERRTERPRRPGGARRPPIFPQQIWP